MVGNAILPALFLLAGLAASAPASFTTSLSSAGAVFHVKRAAVKSAAALIKEVMPTADTCDGAQFPDECRTADQAAPFLVSAMAQYQLYTYGEIAAVLALVGFESVDMKFKHNVSPGRAGQGTSNMQLADNNLLYAQSIPALKARSGSLTADNVLAAVTDDKYNFGSGPWYLTTHDACAGVPDQLKKGTDAAFQAYMACVGVSVTSDRLEYWTRAKTAFGLSG